MFKPAWSVVVGGIVCAVARADLNSYVQKPDPSYSWRRIDEPPADGEDTVAELRMVSQTWRGIEWKHKLFVVRPAAMEKTSQAILIIAGGSWNDDRDATRPTEKPKELALARGIAAMAKMPVAFVLQVPFQPMFDGRKEDQIISYTFDKYMRTGEEDWPLLLPMTKAAVRAMDTVQAFARKEWKLDIRQFMVTGGSKRGWTTWLTGAVDKRAAGIAPMVIDVLNIPAQMKHQIESYGRYSEQIRDYTDIKLQDQLETEKGKKLVSIVDPYAYRRRLTMPKLIILGSNDPYWTLD
jgi:PhoPQ-activated pathogenicity-related protein